MEPYKQICDLSSNAILIADPQGIIEYVNPVWTKISLAKLDTGSEVDDIEMRSANFGKALLWEDIAEASAHNPFTISVRITYQPDRTYKCNMRHTTLLNKRYFYLELTDITHQQILESKIAERESILKRVINDFPEGICACDDQGIIKIWNKSCEEITGRSAQEMINNPSAIAPLFSNKRDFVTAEERWQNRDENVVNNWTMHIARPDGQSRTVSMTVRFRENPILPGLNKWVIASDITALVAAREALTKSEERYRVISKATNDALWDWNLETGELWWNDGITDLFGYEEREIENTIDWWVDRLHPTYRESVYERLKQHAYSGLPLWSDEYMFLRKDGTYAYIYDRGYVMNNDAGKPHRMIGGMVDLTAQKEFEKLVEEKSDQLRKVLVYNSSKIVTPAVRMTNLARQLAFMQHTDMEIKNLADQILLAAHEAETAARRINERFQNQPN